MIELDKKIIELADQFYKLEKSVGMFTLLIKNVVRSNQALINQQKVYLYNDYNSVWPAQLYDKNTPFFSLNTDEIELGVDIELTRGSIVEGTVINYVIDISENKDKSILSRFSIWRKTYEKAFLNQKTNIL